MSSAAAAAAMASAAMAASAVDGLEVAGRNVEKMLHVDSQFPSLQVSLITYTVLLQHYHASSLHIYAAYRIYGHRT